MLIIQVAKALIELFGEMIFVHGFVHGDPHPGNILVSPQGQGKFSLGALFCLKTWHFLHVYMHIFIL
jgi:predicted unusual protein kinase regulating ubiquinone biosynthesis (AarF/ABC1/UbiB family)